MSKLSQVIARRQNAKKELYDANAEMRIEIREAVKARGGAFAADLADEAGVPSCAIANIMASTLIARKRTRRVTYVRLNDDNSVNMDDLLIKKSRVNYYTVD